jgi:hypothetical protein
MFAWLFPARPVVAERRSVRDETVRMWTLGTSLCCTQRGRREACASEPGHDWYRLRRGCRGSLQAPFGQGPSL